jgi:hypothetical protein
MQGRDHKNLYIGCGFATLGALMGLAIILLLIFNREQHAVRYPGAQIMRNLTQSTIRPTYIRLDNGYRSKTERLYIRNWYADTFKLRISEENDECVGMGGTTQGLAFQQMTSVTICEGAGGQRTIWITRMISRH